MIRTQDILTPKVALHTYDVLALVLDQLFWDRLVGINLRHRQITADCQRLQVVILRVLVLQLVVVEVAPACRGHHGTMVLAGCCNPTFHTTPRHDHGTLAQSALQSLVPPHEDTSALAEELVKLLVDIRLEFRLTA